MISDIIYHYVYRITNLVENKHYYGKRSSKIEPKQDLGNKYFSSSTDKAFILDQKNNPQNYKYKIVQYFKTSKDAITREAKLHQYFNVGVNSKFYNRTKQTINGFDWSGIKHSTETCIKLSEAHKGKIVSEETKAKMSDAHIGQYRSEATKLKISTANKGRKYTAEQNAKNSERQRGRIASEETRAKLSAALKGKKQKARSKETKTKISECQKLFYYITPFGIIDDSSNGLGLVSRSSLLRWCNNPNKVINKIAYTKSNYLHSNYSINEVMGKTFGVLGFYKIRKESFCLLKA